MEDGWRRLLGLPYNTHCYLLPLLINSLPVFDQICKRSAGFIVSCLFSHSSLVRSIAWTGVLNGKYTSVLSTNRLLYAVNDLDGQLMNLP